MSILSSILLIRIHVFFSIISHVYKVLLQISQPYTSSNFKEYHPQELYVQFEVPSIGPQTLR